MLGGDRNGARRWRQCWGLANTQRPAIAPICPYALRYGAILYDTTRNTAKRRIALREQCRAMLGNVGQQRRTLGGSAAERWPTSAARIAGNAGERWPTSAGRWAGAAPAYVHICGLFVM